MHPCKHCIEVCTPLQWDIRHYKTVSTGWIRSCSCPRELSGNCHVNASLATKLSCPRNLIIFLKGMVVRIRPNRQAAMVFDWQQDSWVLETGFPMWDKHIPAWFGALPLKILKAILSYSCEMQIPTNAPWCQYHCCTNKIITWTRWQFLISSRLETKCQIRTPKLHTSLAEELLNHGGFQWNSEKSKLPN